MSYSPGQPKPAVKIAENTYSVDSFRGERVAYTVTLGERPTCTCPHWTKRLAELDGVAECKHIQSVKQQEHFARLLEIAQTVGDSELERLLQRYTERGDVVVAGAIRCERHRRRAAAQQDAAMRAIFA